MQIPSSLTLCADDFGLSRGISHAIRVLAQQGRLNATSCMVGGADWVASAPQLQDMPTDFKVGLHFTLTELAPLGAMPNLAPNGTFPTLGTLMRRALLRQLDAAEIMAEGQRQMEAFITALGRPPAHIDGHQHIHCFPTIRETVLTLAKNYGCAVRNCETPLQAIRTQQAQASKAIALNILGAGFNRRLRQAAIPHNHIFFGLHDFDPTANIHDYYAAWLATAPVGTQINCHPAAADYPGDPIAAWRQAEYAYLASPRFGDLLASTQENLLISA